MRYKWRRLLLRSLEGTLSDRKQRRLDAALENHPQLKADRAMLEQTQQWFDKAPEFSFQPFFAQRVTQRIYKAVQDPPDLFVLIYSKFKRLAIAASLIIALLISINIMQNHSYPVIYNYLISNMTVEETFTPNLAESLEDLL
ncbi:MAG: hypothetical protein U5R06_11160 [candidate division KSB1 bacterium]|nr:hypothetical protein [candidate division KSB1 bacterium]